MPQSLYFNNNSEKSSMQVLLSKNA
jgi:hypothetical protein